MRSLFLIMVAALPAHAQTRVELNAVLPRVQSPPAAVLSSVAPSLNPADMVAPVLSPLAATSAAVPIAPRAVPPAAAPALSPAQQISAMGAQVGKALEHAGNLRAASIGDSHDAGRALENILSGAVEPAGAAASAEELDFVAGAPSRLAGSTDDLAGERGLKARAMSGEQFLGLVTEARVRADAEEKAPTSAAELAARDVRAAVERVARALIPADKPVIESLARAMSVWQVMGQEMSEAAKKGVLSAVTDDARLFAEQVEASVAPAPAAPRTGLLPSAHPEDAEGYAELSEPGSVFGWQPIEKSPGHGFPPLDALIRRALAEPAVPAFDRGFELSGALRREDARVYFYGERHTDGGLIAENMRRLVEDARPGKPVIILVEGYTGWAMRGHDALKYLAARGLDADALAAKGVGGSMVEVRGWDTIDGYNASKHPLLQHHMNLLELNRLSHSDLRGWRYYRDFARAALTAWRSREDLQKIAIHDRNRDLDDAVARAADDADAIGATVHVIAGADHLQENPRLNAALGRLLRPTFRASLRAALAGRAFWASMPASSRP
ncbi:MAG: hypothetical protein ACHQ51_09105 [Elusimicrobiota bacterium]